ncbi:MAG: 1-acyl-sn-glycerol-3-phosphate acyltransferase [Spirochaetaceae bacterium]|jgi:1-acyl-sn-glycerol-3-phosphate acyltransferase|nr:1-acyl-sn-glycerol-3-phosphate acyltransferase [Spirochaetaceae bacterium]
MQSDPVPLKNYAFYIYCVFVKWFSFFLFGLGSLFLVIFIFPLMRLCIHPGKRFQKYARTLISRLFFLFTMIMSLSGAFTIEIDDKNVLKQLKSKIIIANHPSLLDVVVLISFIQNADCIVNARLLHNIISGVVKQLYIPNSLAYEELMALCAESLSDGNCLIIFPEGTRTPREGKNTIKKGAARLAFRNLCGIIPVHIGGSDKYGLGKKDPWYGFNHTGKYTYRLTVLPEISPEPYKKLPEPAAVKRINEEIIRVLFGRMG